MEALQEIAPLDAGAVIEGVVEPVVIVRGGRVAHANGAARRLLGGYILGEDVRLAIRHPAAVEMLIGAAAPTRQGPVDLVGLGGLDQHWEMHVCRLDDDSRVVHLIDRTAHDVAERMRIDFVANASHELRTPLAVILGYVETLADDAAGSDSALRARFLAIMHAEAERMQRLVSDLISLSRIEADKYRPLQDLVDLPALIREVSGEAGETGIVLDLEDAARASIPTPTLLRGDRAQLSQMLHNLIGNARKYGRPAAPVTITLRREEGGLRLSVADHGEGIAAEHLPRLTERFYRVDDGRSRAAGGTGLGLAIVKHIVGRHRGRLDISSVIGTGTTVTVRLPVVPPEKRTLS